MASLEHYVGGHDRPPGATTDGIFGRDYLESALPSRRTFRQSPNVGRCVEMLDGCPGTCRCAAMNAVTDNSGTRQSRPSSLYASGKRPASTHARTVDGERQKRA